MRSTGGLFRGSEFPRLLLLASILVVGWAAFYVWHNRNEERLPPREVQENPLPQPEDRVEFHGIVDKRPLIPRECAAYKLLVDLVRETPVDSLRAESRRDLTYSQFLDNPARYRGLPVHIEGMARRIVQQSAQTTEIWPDKDYYEAVLFTADSQKYPWWVAFEEAPEGLQIGDNIFQPVVFDGYFFKLLAYEAGDALRYAPLLVGRVRPAAPPAGQNADASGWPVRPWWLLALGALLVFGLLRWWIFARGAFRKKAAWTPRSSVPVTDRIEPEDLTAWVEQQAESAEDDDEYHPDPHPDDDDSDGGLLARR